ncbi:guanine nucleotide-binding protein g(o) subunit alpha [Anaeramoeba flamelloides]|uniref:Guanine nucleotide-binding protein g(O) subunit alpha n=1 Tax=Anaeramoeba flamelloides TaxID=1746091 RepID=A0ABQ8ZBP4_9EUKA|nr:guanine nucleotide-binding protein g(o) subunit alpha [Anaeramoeba flamelloides]
MGNKQKKRLKKKRKRNKQIEKDLQKEEEELNKQIKILVLGTGDSGKSTLIKQLQIAYRNGFSERDMKRYKTAIRCNLVLHMKGLVSASLESNLEFDSDNEDYVEEITELQPPSSDSLELVTVKMIKSLWSDSTIQEVFERRHEFGIPDTANFFFDAIDRISEENYEPTEEDILNCRIPTTGVIHLTFEKKNNPWLVVDVGGQRSERRKWMDQFDDVNLLIYVVSLSEYNQNLYEEDNVNRLEESLAVFQKTLNNNYFKKKNCIILFNKLDLFKEKLKKYPFSKSFPKYKGANDPDKIMEWVRKLFLKKVSSKRQIRHLYTIATDTNIIKQLFTSIEEIFI